MQAHHPQNTQEPNNIYPLPPTPSLMHASHSNTSSPLKSEANNEKYEKRGKEHERQRKERERRKRHIRGV
jgi:hypothetical protein